MALNNDLAPRFASWAGVTPPSSVDGRSLSPLLSANPPTSWRTAFLIEHRSSPVEYGYVKAIPEYYAVRTAQYSYVEYPITSTHPTKETEFYDLNADPTELTSLHASPSHQDVISNLKARLDQSKQCRQPVAMRMGRMATCGDEGVLRRPPSEDRGRHRARHAQGRGGPHLRGRHLDRQALRYQGSEKENPWRRARHLVNGPRWTRR